MYKLLPRINYNIKESDIKLRISATPSISVNRSIHKYLNKSKALIDKYSQEWDNIKKYTNDYEFIGGIIPGYKYSISKIKPLSRAFYKLMEIFYISDIISHFPRTPIETFHLAEGPGGFIEAIAYMRKNFNDRYYGMTLIDATNKQVPGWKKSEDFLRKNTNITIEQGADKTGNLYNPDNLLLCIRKYRHSMDIVTADGGFDFSVDYNKQEILSTRLILTQVIYAIHLQKRSGIFILKVFDCFYKGTLDIIYFLSCLYESVGIVKPKSSRMANSEKYLICKNFKYENIDFLSPKLVQIVKIFHKLEVDGCYISSILNIPTQYMFTTRIMEINSILTQQQISTIFKTIKLIENKERKMDKINKLKQTNIQKCIKWCIEHNIPYNVDVQRVNIFLSRNTAI